MFGRLRGRMTFANTMSLIAVFVALGGTSYAAVKLPRNSVGAPQIKTGGVASSEVKNRALRAIDFKPGELPAGAKGDKGDKGDPGTNGTDGTNGENGTADAFARVQANGTLQPDVAGFPSQNKGAILVSKGEGGAATGTYCFDLPFRPASALVSLDNADAAANVDQIVSVAIDRGEDLGDCPANRNDARVRILDTDLTAGGAEQDPGPADARFFIWFEG